MIKEACVHLGSKALSFTKGGGSQTIVSKIYG